MTNEQFNEAITELWALSKAGLLPRVERFQAIESLTERYYSANDKVPEMEQLDRLATLCLYEEVTDRNEHKIAHNDYPIMSERQQERRNGDEVSFSAVADYGTDGKSYRTPKRKKFPANVEKQSRNAERHRKYREFTKVQPVKVYFT